MGSKFFVGLVGLAWTLLGTGAAIADPVVVHGITEGSEEALAIVDVANSTAVSTLVYDVGVDSRAADNVVKYRMEHKVFDSLAELDAIPYLGQDGFSKLLEYGKAHGYIPAIDDPFSPHSCAGAAMTWHEAMVRFKAGTATAALGRYEIRERSRSCEKLMGCSPWKLTPADKFDFQSVGQATLQLENQTPILDMQNQTGAHYYTLRCSGIGRALSCGPMEWTEYNSYYNRVDHHPMKAGTADVTFAGILTNNCLRFTWHSDLGARKNSSWTEIQRVAIGKF